MAGIHGACRSVLWSLVALLVLVPVCRTIAVAQDQPQMTLFDCEQPTMDHIRPSGAQARIIQVDGASRLEIRATEDGNAELTILASGGAWDLSKYESVVMTVWNDSEQPLTIRGLAQNEDGKGLYNTCTGAVQIMPAQRQELRIRLTRRPEDPGYDVFRPFMMYFRNINVKDNTVDPSRVARVVVLIDHARKGQTISLSSVKAMGEAAPGPVPFFPFIDEYGQYIHSDWPGKVYSDEDFARLRQQESQERSDWNGPKDWDQYGGWKDGPTLKATGFFYATKHENKWWLVNPEGKLFWSYGPTGVGFGGDLTPITDREHWFRNLPARDSQWKDFFREGRGALYRYYQQRSWVGLDIGAINLHRKYGPEYKTIVGELSHQRLRSWGFNTIANWSAREVYMLRRTPYTVAIHYDSPMIETRMPDVYHPEWEKNLKARMERERNTTANDPWNIGYFVDNERTWGWRARAANVGQSALRAVADSPSKIKFVQMLREKYSTIEALNQSWGTQYASWDALLESRDGPDMRNEKVLADCGDFGMVFAERYFSVVREVVKSVAPNNMYLGCRFHGHIDPELVRLASRYCDVISYNIYDNPPDRRVNQYRQLDVPILSSEWGIGSDPQQTPFRGEKLEIDPQERAEEMTRYAEAAIRHPLMVGAHFFQYRDQPTSGRPDGEAVLRGFVNITDTPNFNLIQANRRVAYDLYKKRAQAD